MDKLIKILKILILIFSLVFLILYTSLDTSNCGACEFDGKNMKQFMNKYTSECLQVERDLPNISNYNPSNQNS